MNTIAKQSLLVMGIVGILGCENAAPKTADVAKSDPVIPKPIENEYATQKVVASDDDETKQADDDVTSRIREKIANKRLSSNVQGIIITTRAGRVTLQGVVKTADEKQQVEDIARSIAGTQNLWSQLEVE